MDIFWFQNDKWILLKKAFEALRAYLMRKFCRRHYQLLRVTTNFQLPNSDFKKKIHIRLFGGNVCQRWLSEIQKNVTGTYKSFEIIYSITTKFEQSHQETGKISGGPAGKLQCKMCKWAAYGLIVDISSGQTWQIAFLCRLTSSLNAPPSFISV